MEECKKNSTRRLLSTSGEKLIIILNFLIREILLHVALSPSVIESRRTGIVSMDQTDREAVLICCFSEDGAEVRKVRADCGGWMGG